MANVYGLMADLHLHSWSAFSSIDESGMNTRLKGLLNEIYRCAKEVKAAGGEYIVVAGDVFHVRGSVAPTVLNSLKDTLDRIGDELDIHFVIMPGNHDLEGKDSARLSSAVTALESDYVRVVNSISMPSGLDSILVPWFESVEELKKQIEGYLKAASWDTEECDLILHAPIDGVIAGLPAHGLTPEYLASLPVKRVFAGHYHFHKNFDNKVYSIGALAHHTWSDIGTKAGFLIVSDDAVDWRKSHLPEFIDLSKIEGLEEEEIPMLVDKNYVRLRVESSSGAEIEDAKKQLLSFGAAAVTVQAMPKPTVRETEGGTSIVKAGASLEESVRSYISEMKDVPTELVIKEAFAILEATKALSV